MARARKSARLRSRRDDAFHVVPCPFLGSFGKASLFGQRSADDAGVNRRSRHARRRATRPLIWTIHCGSEYLLAPVCGDRSLGNGKVQQKDCFALKGGPPILAPLG